MNKNHILIQFAYVFIVKVGLLWKLSNIEVAKSGFSLITGLFYLKD